MWTKYLLYFIGTTTILLQVGSLVYLGIDHSKFTSSCRVTRDIFYIYIGMCLATIVFIMTLLPFVYDITRRLYFIGGILISALLVSFMIGFIITKITKCMQHVNVMYTYLMIVNAGICSLSLVLCREKKLQHGSTVPWSFRV